MGAFSYCLSLLFVRLTSLQKICVSAVEPELFPACVAAGAEMIELGNFDSFYDQGITFSAEDVLEMTRQTRSLLPTTVLSVTVPHTLDLDEQASKMYPCADTFLSGPRGGSRFTE